MSCFQSVLSAPAYESMQGRDDFREEEEGKYSMLPSLPPAWDARSVITVPGGSSQVEGTSVFDRLGRATGEIEISNAEIEEKYSSDSASDKDDYDMVEYSVAQEKEAEALRMHARLQYVLSAPSSESMQGSDDFREEEEDEKEEEERNYSILPSPPPARSTRSVITVPGGSSRVEKTSVFDRLGWARGEMGVPRDEIEKYRSDKDGYGTVEYSFAEEKEVEAMIIHARLHSVLSAPASESMQGSDDFREEEDDEKEEGNSMLPSPPPAQSTRPVITVPGGSSRVEETSVFDRLGWARGEMGIPRDQVKKCSSNSASDKDGYDMEYSSSQVPVPAMVQKFLSRTPAPAATRSLDDPDSRSLFVTNVHFGATKDALSRHFNKFGTVLKVIILTDVTTGQPTGLSERTPKKLVPHPCQAGPQPGLAMPLPCHPSRLSGHHMQCRVGQQ